MKFHEWMNEIQAVKTRSELLRDEIEHPPENQHQNLIKWLESAYRAGHEDRTPSVITREAYEGDIVDRLRNWRGLHLAHGGRLFEEAADEIERLRSE
jgi:hypothetical protein